MKAALLSLFALTAVASARLGEDQRAVSARLKKAGWDLRMDKEDFWTKGRALTFWKADLRAEIIVLKGVVAMERYSGITKAVAAEILKLQEDGQWEEQSGGNRWHNASGSRAVYENERLTIIDAKSAAKEPEKKPNPAEGL